MRIYNLNTIILTGYLSVLIILYGIITSSINYIGCSGENYSVAVLHSTRYDNSKGPRIGPSLFYTSELYNKYIKSIRVSTSYLFSSKSSCPIVLPNTSWDIYISNPNTCIIFIKHIFIMIRTIIPTSISAISIIRSCCNIFARSKR